MRSLGRDNNLIPCFAMWRDDREDRHAIQRTPFEQIHARERHDERDSIFECK